MLTKTLAVSVIAAAVLAGCSSTTGPAFNISEIQTSNGQKAFRAECHGLFENGSACMTAAQKMCGNQKVNVLETIAGTKTPSDSRDVIFNCVTPAEPAPAPAPVVAQPAPAPAPVVAPRKLTLGAATNFAVDSAVLTPNAKQILDKFIADAQGVKFSSLTVSGYTDSTASVSHNLALSDRRARAVMDYLKAHGLNADIYSAKGYGKANPIASNATVAGRAENRRVEVVVTP
ncbi:OmpA family protein [Caballeronia temeraria]|nr:OmpA family protein [Caballeronia temeraria]